MAAKYSMIRCIDCTHGSYMQWFHNPIICYCDAFEEKFVAEARRVCENYDERPTPVDRETGVVHHDHY